MKPIFLFLLLCMILFHSCKDTTIAPGAVTENNNRLIREAILGYGEYPCNPSHTIYIAFGIEDVPDSLFDSPLRDSKLTAPDNESIKRFKNICTSYEAYNISVLSSGGNLVVFHPVVYLTPIQAKVRVEQWFFASRPSGSGKEWFLHFQSNTWIVDSTKATFRT